MEIQALAIPLVSRRKGMMLAVPIGLLKESLLSLSGVVEEDALIGPSQVFEVDMITEDEFTGATVAAGFKSDVQVVDFPNDILNYLKEYDPVTDSTEDITGFHEAHPQAIPSSSELLALVLSWAESEALSRVHFYSAREEPVGKTPQTPKKAPAKRLTNAALAEQVSQLSVQVSLLLASQAKANTEPEPAQVRSTTPVIPVREAGALVPTGPVPKMPPVSLGLQTPGPHLPPAKALQQQAVALNALVSHLIQGGDSLHSGGASSSTARGTVKRERLQQELAARQSTLFLALQQQIFRRLHPSAVLPRTEEEIQRRSPSLLTYLERYGGVRGQREAGLIMWIFAHALDAAASGDFYAIKEYLALGIMALEQSAFDAGDWGLAYVLPSWKIRLRFSFRIECSPSQQQDVLLRL